MNRGKRGRLPATGQCHSRENKIVMSCIRDPPRARRWNPSASTYVTVDVLCLLLTLSTRFHSRQHSSARVSLLSADGRAASAVDPVGHHGLEVCLIGNVRCGPTLRGIQVSATMKNSNFEEQRVLRPMMQCCTLLVRYTCTAESVSAERIGWGFCLFGMFIRSERRLAAVRAVKNPCAKLVRLRISCRVFFFFFQFQKKKKNPIR